MSNENSDELELQLQQQLGLLNLISKPEVKAEPKAEPKPKRKQKTKSPLYNKLEPVINKIKENTKFALLVRAKANLITRTETILEHGYHIDVDDAPSNLKTSILYLNTSDGYTKFKDGSVVTSECNRFVTFDGSTEHTGTTCTNEPVRIVLNLNYITN